ncbi:MAG: 50S ribosomal protein L24 [Thermoplasmatota archaeon]
MVTIQPRKQRKTLYNLPPHARRKHIAAHLSEPLLLKYNRRSITVRKGDTVKVLRGDFKGHSGKILQIDSRRMRITVDGVTVDTAKHQKKPRWIDPSNVLIVKLELTDPFRREKLGAAEADIAEEDRAKPKMEKKAPKKAAADENAEDEADETDAKPAAADEDAETAEDADDDADDDAESKPKPKTSKKKTPKKEASE